MISLTLIITIIVTTVLLERFVKPITIRVIGVLILVAASSGIAANMGIYLGKVEQLNRFSRLLPLAFATLDKHKDQPETLGSVISFFRNIVNDPSKLDHFESSINEIEKSGEK